MKKYNEVGESNIDRKAKVKYQYDGNWYDGYSSHKAKVKYQYDGNWYDGYSRN